MVPERLEHAVDLVTDLAVVVVVRVVGVVLIL